MSFSPHHIYERIESCLAVIMSTVEERIHAPCDFAHQIVPVQDPPKFSLIALCHGGAKED